MSKFNEIARQLGGQAEPIKKSKEDYVPVSASDMAVATSNRIQAALEGAQNAEVVSPMVRKLFSGYRVKIGYGNRNEKIAGLEELHFPSLEAVANYLSQVKKAMDEGECDENFEQLLESYRHRAELGKQARRAKSKAPLAA